MNRRAPKTSLSPPGIHLWAFSPLAFLEFGALSMNLPFLVLMLSICGLYLFQRRARSHLDLFPETNPADGLPTSEHCAPHSTSPGARSDPTMLQASDEERIPEQLFFPEDDLPPKRCPRCERTFPGVFDLCPYDNAPLHDRFIKIDRPDRNLLARNFCLQCGRRYHLGVDYCHHDGAPLERDYKGAAEAAPELRFCRRCGLQTDQKWKRCPRDGEALETLEPARWEITAPMLPIMHCLTCGHIGAPGDHRCPRDNAILMPMESTHLLALPDAGFGPRRHLCRECGEEFSDHCHFCCHDGSELVPMN